MSQLMPMRWEAAASGEEARKNAKPATVAIAPRGRRTKRSNVPEPSPFETASACAGSPPAVPAAKPGAGPAVTDRLVFVPMINGAVESYKLALKEYRQPPWVFKSHGRAVIQPIYTGINGW